MLKIAIILSLISCAAQAANLPDASRFADKVPSLPAPKASALTAPEATRAMKELTLLFYINGKNNLFKSANWMMRDLQTEGSSAEVNILAEIGLPRKGAWQGSKRYYITREDTSSGEWVRSSPLMEFPDGDMGDWKQLSSFIEWGKKNYPARRYILTVWNHGGGVLDGYVPGPEAIEDKTALAGNKKPKGISQDYETSHQISVPDLARAIADNGGADVLVLYACNMQQAEVAYQVKDSVKMVIGSQEVMREMYKTRPLISAILKKPGASLKEIAAMHLEANKLIANDLNMNTTISALDTSAMPGLCRLASEWGELAIRNADKNELRRVINRESVRFMDSSYKDLGDVAALSAKTAGPGEFADKSAELRAYIGKNAVMANHTNSELGAGNDEAMSRATGVSVYLSSLGEPNPGYRQSAWAKDCPGWLNFMEWLGKIW